MFVKPDLRWLTILTILPITLTANCADDTGDDAGAAGAGATNGAEGGAPSTGGVPNEGTAGTLGETPQAGTGTEGPSSGGALGNPPSSSGGGDTGSAGDDGGGSGGAGGSDTGASSGTVRLPTDAEYTSGEPPETNSEDELPAIVGLKGATATTNGGTTTVRIELDGAPENPTFVVVIDGDDGFFIATATDTNGDGIYEIEIQIDKDIDVSKLRVSIAPIDAKGNVGAYQSLEYDIVKSGVGEVKITLSFDQDADLDLHVIEPNGFEISFERAASSTNGKLDLDSNANCIVDGKNTENVFWPKDMAPDGEYSVFVTYFAECGVKEDVGYTVTVYNGPGVETFRGTFESGTVEEKRLIGRFVH